MQQSTYVSTAGNYELIQELKSSNILSLSATTYLNITPTMSKVTCLGATYKQIAKWDVYQ
ncbi:hypothetical protein BTUL_0090g00150 [Botrytis tulipae]|uniref:Uncharacterized protein n=1 Tax=Botrytis tulipae TaxID=87230 RepID=A0A4Z1EIH5_9HELO|nr:hypothetical protein BTUL_0090g00150 [Botrytis tulipae]